jgi:hypothetical protein
MNNKEDHNINDIVQNLKSPIFWKRFLYMMLFIIAYILAEVTVWAVIAFLIFYTLFTGNSNERAVTFSRQTSAYIYHLLLYLTYNTEERPFPFTDWPKPERMPTGLGRPLTPKSEESMTKSTFSQSANPTVGTAKSASETTSANPTSRSGESSETE